MKYKILVVDDDKELVKMLCSYFNMKQYETITATDGMEALNKIKMKPDIILLDINMPRIAEKEQEEKKKIQKEWDSVNKRTKTIPKNQGTKKDSEVHPKEAAEQEEKHISKKKSKDSGQMSLFDMMQPKES